MQILFVSREHDECRVQWRLAKYLAGYGYSARFVSLSRKAVTSLRREGAQAECFLDHALELRDHGKGQDAFTALERRYGLLALRVLYQFDRTAGGKTLEQLAVQTAQYLAAWEAYFDRNSNIDWVLPDLGTELIRRTAYVVCRRRGVRQMFWFYKPVPKPLLLPVDDYDARPFPLEAMLHVTPDEEAEAERFIREFAARDDVFVRMRKPRFTLRRLAKFGGLVTDAVRGEAENEYVHPVFVLKNAIRRMVRASCNRRVYVPPDWDVPYIYFPLHVSQDFKVSVMATECIEQDYLIRLCARALPEGVRLYVKEHPSFVGGESATWLRRLMVTKNVVIVPPETSNRQLIRSARAVVVISSTTGLEALFYGKPVMTFGRPFYADHGLTTDVANFAGTGKALQEVLMSRGPERATLRRYMAALMKSTFAGVPPLVDPSDENLMVLATSIRTRIEMEQGPMRPTHDDSITI